MSRKREKKKEKSERQKYNDSNMKKKYGDFVTNFNKV